MSSFLSPLAHRLLPIAIVLSSFIAGGAETVIINRAETVSPTTPQDVALRPMTFLDVQLLAPRLD